MGILLIALYLAVLLLLCGYGLHRARLAWLCLRCQPPHRAKLLPPEQLPTVTVQLPIFNEATVAARLIEATGRLDYPARQAGDSGARRLGRRDRAHRREAGRAPARRAGSTSRTCAGRSRHGYKAGALDYGLQSAKGELIAIFDADFVPPPDFLRHGGALPTREHRHGADSLGSHEPRRQLVHAGLQALMLDGHHLVENRARFGAGCHVQLLRHGGIWRRAAIDAAGGWQHDTLTEDLDLSYRAQMAG